MPLILSYGSLQQPDVQRATFGRVLDGRPDELPGFARVLVPIDDPDEVMASGQTHHANVVATGADIDRVPGGAFEVSEAELFAADDYERRAVYMRVAVTLTSGAQAWVYVHGPSLSRVG